MPGLPFEAYRCSEFDGTDGSRHEDEGPMSLEDLALQLAIEEVYESTGSKWKPWASMRSTSIRVLIADLAAVNGKALRLGEIILIVDSDTIVPEGCFRDANQRKLQLHCWRTPS